MLTTIDEDKHSLLASQLCKSILRTKLQRKVAACPETPRTREISCHVHARGEAPKNGTELFDNVIQIAASLGLAVEVMSCNWRSAHLRFQRPSLLTGIRSVLLMQAQRSGECNIYTTSPPSKDQGCQLVFWNIPHPMVNSDTNSIIMSTALA